MPSASAPLTPGRTNRTRRPLKLVTTGSQPHARQANGPAGSDLNRLRLARADRFFRDPALHPIRIAQIPSVLGAALDRSICPHSTVLCRSSVSGSASMAGSFVERKELHCDGSGWPLSTHKRRSGSQLTTVCLQTWSRQMRKSRRGQLLGHCGHSPIADSAIRKCVSNVGFRKR